MCQGYEEEYKRNNASLCFFALITTETNAIVRVIMDEIGEIGTISRARMDMLIARIAPVLDMGSEGGISANGIWKTGC